MKWGNNGLQDKQYTFTYDSLNRLKKAIYSPDEAYNEEISKYDRNGNIMNLIRKGYVHQTTMDPVIGDIDNLTLGYYGNQLVSVSDAVNSAYNITTNDFKDHSTSAYVECQYDANGNMTSDYNKGIAWIKYNSLNLPSKIQFMNGNKSEYLYDASGVKRESKYSYAVTTMQIPWGQTSIENTGSNLCLKSKTDYCGSYIYENDTIKRILTSEGYIQTEGVNPANNISNWKYTYFLKDHLGNTRAQLISSSIGGPKSTNYTVAGLTDYYPFGMEISTPEGLLTSGKNPYLYNGKEMDRMNGLEMYDYGARFYDPTIGRWRSIDPRAEEVNNLSPYNYVANNPIIANDPDGEFLNVIIGAVVGAVTEMTSQIVSKLVKGISVTDAIKNMDWADVGVSSVEGALIGSGVGAVAAVGIGAGCAVARSGVDVTATNGFQVAGFNKPRNDVGRDLLGEFVGMATGSLLKPIGNMAGKAVSDAFVKNGFKSGAHFLAGVVVTDLTSGFVNGVTSGLVNGAYSSTLDAVGPEGSPKPVRYPEVILPEVTITCDRKTKKLLPSEMKKVQEHIKDHGYKSFY